MSSKIILKAEKVGKEFNRVQVLSDIDFDLRAGEIHALIGENGAGKSTIIKCICGLLRFQGEIKIDSFQNKSLDAKRLLGYIPEMPAVYDLLTVKEHIEFILRSYKMEDDGYGDSLLERFELWDKKDKLGKELSKGMQQKLSICCALVHKPKVIIFDEPMVGLDPHAIKELKEIIIKLKKEGASILISTHMFDSVESSFDKAYIMQKGQIKAERRADAESDKTLEEMFFEITEGGNEE